MYRILEANQEVRERRDQLRHPNYAAPQLLATAPNQLWSWDITKLLGPAKWTYFYLYVILDVFSRYVVGWMVAHRESAALAEKLIRDTCQRQGIVPGQLTLHADRGSSMTSKPVALLLADLGVTKIAQPAVRLRRQPVLRIAVQDDEVPAGVPRSLRLDGGRACLLPGSSSPGTTPSIGTEGSPGCCLPTARESPRRESAPVRRAESDPS